MRIQSVNQSIIYFTRGVRQPYVFCLLFCRRCHVFCLPLFCFVLSAFVDSRPSVQSFFDVHTPRQPYCSMCPLHTNRGFGKRETRINSSMVTCKGSTRSWNYLEDYRSCADGLSAVNAIGAQMRDQINSELTRWRMAVYINKWMPPRNSGGIQRG